MNRMMDAAAAPASIAGVVDALPAQNNRLYQAQMPASPLIDANQFADIMNRRSQGNVTEQEMQMALQYIEAQREPVTQARPILPQVSPQARSMLNPFGTLSDTLAKANKRAKRR